MQMTIADMLAHTCTQNDGAVVQAQASATANADMQHAQQQQAEQRLHAAQQELHAAQDLHSRTAAEYDAQISAMAQQVRG